MIDAAEITKETLIVELEEKSVSELASLLADVLWTYVLEPKKEQAKETQEQYEKEYRQTEDCFADLMQRLVAQYRFTELRRFRIEGHRVFLMFHDQEIEIKSQMEDLSLNKVKQVVKKQPRTGVKPKQSDIRDDIKLPDYIRFENLEL